MSNNATTATTPAQNLETVFLCYHGEEREFTPLSDIIEFGAPTDDNGNQLELWDNCLYAWDEEERRFVDIAGF